MAGELDIMDTSFRDELLSLPAPLAFIDFEAFMPQQPGVIPGTMTTDTIPCQWSCHTLWEHGLEWEGKLTHDEFLWTGDVGWNPIYAFTRTLYEATESANTILIYTGYEIRCLNMCIQLAENDMDKWKINDLLMGYSVYDIDGNYKTLAEAYDMLFDWIENQDTFLVYDEQGNSLPIEEIGDLVEEWYYKDPLPIDYVVAGDAECTKIPLMDIAPLVRGWCESMLSRFYDQCYGNIQNGKELHDGGVERWLQSREFSNSNSIKHIMPVAMEEYSKTAELLESEGEPADGYVGLRAMGNIAKGDECTTHYLAALNRPKRENTPANEDGAAPFDANIEAQCLIYCRLDTLSMVVIYLAVLEASNLWEEIAYGSFADYAILPDEKAHFIEVDSDNQVFYKGCDEYHEEPLPLSTELTLISDGTLSSLPVRERYAMICPKCRRITDMNSRRY